MEIIEKYYKVIACIDKCKTLGGLAICEEMINDISKDMPMTGAHLANVALEKRVQLLTTRYSEVE
jgi:hypothetical protein